MRSEHDVKPDWVARLRSSRGSLLLVAIISLLGGLITMGVVWRHDQWMRDHMLSRVRVAARGVNTGALKQLSGTGQDVGHPAYQQIKQFLMLVREDNPDIRFTYLMKRRADGQIIVLADSEPPDSTDYSSPGDVYYEESPDLQMVFDTGSIAACKPFTDRWGSWVSTLAPVQDRYDNEVLAVFGMDVDARAWRQAHIKAGLWPTLLTITLAMMAWVATRSGMTRPRRRFDHPLVPVVVLTAAGALLSGFAGWYVHQAETHQFYRAFQNLVDVDVYRFDYTFAPVHQTGSGPLAPEEIERSLVDTVERMWRDAYLHYRVDRLAAGVPPEEIANSCPLPHPLTDISLSYYLDAMGYPFRVQFHPSPNFLLFHPVRAALVTVVLGMLSTAAAVVLLGVPARRRKLLEEMVLERTAALTESEKRYEMLTKQSLTVSWDVDLDGTYTFISDVVELLTGYTPEEIIGKKQFYDLSPPEDRDRLKDFGLKIIHEGRMMTSHENRLLSKRGRIVWVRSSGLPLCDAAGRTIGYRGWDIDFTELKNAEIEQARLLEESRHREQELLRLSTAIEQSADSVVITDVNGSIQYVNPAFMRVSGYTREEAIGQNPRILKSGAQNTDFYKVMWQTMLSGQVWSGQLKNRRKNGELFTEEVSIAPVRNTEGVITHMVAIKRDITRELEREDFIRQTQKMDSIGLLAGGIAHDFNNMLAVILGNASLLEKKLKPEHDELRDEVQEILKAARRSADLTRQLLTFARRQPVKSQILDLNKKVEESMSLIRRLVLGHVSLAFHPAPEPALVAIDPSQLDQVVLNLCSNACDAMKGGGSLVLEVHRVIVSAEQLVGREQVKPGEFIMLSVRDTGCGIEPEHLKRIFEPFFTTKPRGKGTGLGLATVYGVVGQGAGFVDVKSAIGVGTTFEIYLPFQKTAMITGQSMVEAPASEQLQVGKSVLVVEDELNVLAITARMLQDLGCMVYQAELPTEALRIMKKHAASIDLLITDVVMPDMNGQELMDAIHKIKPGLPCVFMSGYTADFIRTQGVQTRQGRLLQKPFTSGQMATAIHGALAEADRSGQATGI